MVTKAAKIDRVDAEIDEISKRILLELESASSEDLSDVRYAKKILHLADIHYAKRVLQQIGNVKKQSSGTESEIEKRAVIKVLLFSTWLQRLYFIIRSFLMGLIGGVVTFLFIWYIGSIDAVGIFVLGIFVFVLSLVVTRLFDTQITKATKKIVELLASHRTARDFIMKHF
jgi:VIT1/CCC1 family predicted Fe2+/Mn2+ transporter